MQIESSSHTPDTIIEHINNIVKAKENASIPKLIESFKNILHKETPLFVLRSHSDSKYIKFQCRNHNVTKCKAIINLVVADGYVYLGKTNHIHNHNLDLMPTTKKIHLAPDIVEDIKNMTRLGMSTNQIRINKFITCSKDAFYNAKRKVVYEERCDELSKINMLLDQNSSWVYNIKLNENQKVEIISCINTEIIKSVHNINEMFLDDTVCVTRSNMALYGCIIIDQNKNSQLIAFMLTTSKTSDIIELFLQFLKTHLRHKPKAFIVDQSKAQIKAIKSIFPESHISFCVLHLYKNMKIKISSTLVQKAY